jgi:hypothetical protein
MHKNLKISRKMTGGRTASYSRITKKVAQSGQQQRRQRLKTLLQRKLLLRRRRPQLLRFEVYLLYRYNVQTLTLHTRI